MISMQVSRAPGFPHVLSASFPIHWEQADICFHNDALHGVTPWALCAI
jgi:hypothetical protein